eukprot:scaffold24_cov341-Pavlova_lutheri.AAC.6
MSLVVPMGAIKLMWAVVVILRVSSTGIFRRFIFPWQDNSKSLVAWGFRSSHGVIWSIKKLRSFRWSTCDQCPKGALTTVCGVPHRDGKFYVVKFDTQVVLSSSSCYNFFVSIDDSIILRNPPRILTDALDEKCIHEMHPTRFAC